MCPERQMEIKIFFEAQKQSGQLPADFGVELQFSQQYAQSGNSKITSTPSKLSGQQNYSYGPSTANNANIGPNATMSALNTNSGSNLSNNSGSNITGSNCTGPSNSVGALNNNANANSTANNNNTSVIGTKSVQPSFKEELSFNHTFASVGKNIANTLNQQIGSTYDSHAYTTTQSLGNMAPGSMKYPGLDNDAKPSMITQSINSSLQTCAQPPTHLQLQSLSQEPRLYPEILSERKTQTQ